MQSLSLFALILALAPSSYARPQEPAAVELVEIAYRPAVGLALERSWEVEHDLVSESILNSRGDQMIPLPGT